MSGHGTRSSNAHHRSVPGQQQDTFVCSDSRSYARSMMSRFNSNFDRKRRQNTDASSRPSTPTKFSDVIPSAQLLSVERTEFYPRENAKEHHTDLYDLTTDRQTPTPVLRRGLHFFFAIRFDRSFEPEKDFVRICFVFGPKSSVPKKTEVILPISQEPGEVINKFKWNVNVHRQDGNILSLKVFIPSLAQVGIWHCSVRTSFSGQRDQSRDYKCEEDIYVLFNPWCRDDAVFMEGELERREYVLNEIGKVWTGTYRQPKGRRWIYGQFDDIVLPAVMYLLEQSGLPHLDRGSPVQVVRAITAGVSSTNNTGLLVSCWNGEFKDGTSPHTWTGSVAILEQYLREGGQPVKYGQCWVYSGVVVSICRALGIPCRSVTNYVSAHDTNHSLTVDKYFDKDGNEFEQSPQRLFDSCWNFHVWNDVWISRPDLPSGFGGWQIIDATSHDDCDSVCKCGPTSVEAVRRGQIGFLYDTPFVFSEVNAELRHFQEDAQSNWGFSRVSVNKHYVGRKIVTKRMDRDDDESDNDLLEITTEYKNPDISYTERVSVINAIRCHLRPNQQEISIQQSDVYFDVINTDIIPFGHNFDVLLNIQNKSNEVRTITAVLSANSVYYTGSLAARIKRTQGELIVKPGQRESLKLHVASTEYLDKMVNHGCIKVYAIARVKETRQTWSEEDDLVLQKPRMVVQVRSGARTGQECCVNFSFQNPLSIILTDCCFTIEGPGLQRAKQIKYRDVRSGELVTFSDTFVPRKLGDRKIVAIFTCKQIDEISGSGSVNVHN